MTHNGNGHQNNKFKKIGKIMIEINQIILRNYIRNI